MLEFSENSGFGGSFNASSATSAALRIGDDSSDRQFRSILSFDTSALPNNAQLTGAALQLVRGSTSPEGSNPFSTFGAATVDISPGFGGSLSLQTRDFSAAPGAAGVGSLSDDGVRAVAGLSAAGLAAISKTGRTQLRVRFTVDDDEDRSSDFVGYRSGNDAALANRPTFTVLFIARSTPDPRASGQYHQTGRDARAGGRVRRSSPTSC